MPRSVTLRLGPSPHGAPLDRGSILFVGTATVVAQLGPFTILTDPNFLHAGDHAHLGYGLTSPRLTSPALELDALPPLDACVLSHLHGDHWDEVAEAGLRRDLPVLTTARAARTLRRRGFEAAQGLSTWDDVVLRRGAAWLRITAVPARHGPPLFHALLPPVMGTVWELGHGTGGARFRMYVSGDTLLHDDLRDIPRRYPRLDLGLFHLGGTRVLGARVTLDARQGVEAVRLVAPDVAIPIHFDDYPVFSSPLSDFARAVAEAGLAHRVRFLARGERHPLTFRGMPRAAPAPGEPVSAVRPDRGPAGAESPGADPGR
jgi:L-ascorbate metabolism protein UlaG (beta-lactamase superfamily)